MPLLLGGAHTPLVAAALRAELDAHPERHGLAPGPRHWVIGMLTNKQGPEILLSLLASGDQAWNMPVEGHASWGAAELAAACLALADQLQGVTYLDAALQQAGTGSAGPVVVAGSLYLLGHLLSQDRSTRNEPWVCCCSQGGTDRFRCYNQDQRFSIACGCSAQDVAHAFHGPVPNSVWPYENSHSIWTDSLGLSQQSGLRAGVVHVYTESQVPQAE